MEIRIRIIPENETEIELLKKLNSGTSKRQSNRESGAMTNSQIQFGTHVQKYTEFEQEFEVTPWSCVLRNVTIIITPSFLSTSHHKKEAKVTDQESVFIYLLRIFFSHSSRAFFSEKYMTMARSMNRKAIIHNGSSTCGSIPCIFSVSEITVMARADDIRSVNSCIPTDRRV